MEVKCAGKYAEPMKTALLVTAIFVGMVWVGRVGFPLGFAVCDSESPVRVPSPPVATPLPWPC